MYHTYTICSLAEERSRGTVLDPISMGCGFEPHLKHCVVFLNMTLNILCSVLVSPDEVGGILFWRRSSVHPSVCLSVHMSFQKHTLVPISQIWCIQFLCMNGYYHGQSQVRIQRGGGQGVRTSPGKSQVIYFL